MYTIFIIKCLHNNITTSHMDVRELTNITSQWKKYLRNARSVNRQTDRRTLLFKI